MPPPYRPKPPRGPLADRVAQTPVEERAKAKAQILRENNSARTFDRDGVRYTVNNVKLVSMNDEGLVDDPNGHVLHVHVNAVKLGPGGGPLPTNNPYLFVNPPLLVPDGTWHTETREQADGTTAEVDVPNYIEDPKAAFEAAVAAAVIR